MSKFARRLELALQMNNMRAVELSKKTGISEAMLSQYRGGYCSPKMDRVMIIAEALKVSPSWLVGYDTPVQPGSDEGHDVFDSLSPENKIRALDYMKYLKSKEPRNEEK